MLPMAKSLEEYQAMADAAHSVNDKLFDCIAVLRGACALSPEFDDRRRLLDIAVALATEAQDIIEPHI
jgi:hypothetical protein